METTTLSIPTGDRTFADLTGAVRSFCAGLGDGLCSVFVPHATAGLAVMELGSGTEQDLAELIDRVLPASDIYAHRHGSTGHGRDHVVPALISPSVTIPVVGNEPQIGIWQSVVLVDTNRDNPIRTVVLSFISG